MSAHREVLEIHKEEFLRYIPAHAVALKWNLYKIIPDDLLHEIHEATPTRAAEKLYTFLYEQGTLETVQKACDLMVEIGSEGYPRMRVLGEIMRTELDHSLSRGLKSVYSMCVCVCAYICMYFTVFPSDKN